MRFCVVELEGRSEPTLAVGKDGGVLPLDAPASLRCALESYGGEGLMKLAGDARGARFFFTAAPDEGAHAFVEEGRLRLRTEHDSQELVDARELQLLGRHNVLNALAAALAARLAGAAPEAISDGLRRERPLPHRLEPVVERHGILWVNDSKSTNLAAAASALASMERPVVVLLGGTDKGEDFGALRAEIDRIARAVVAFGAAGDRIADALEGAAPIRRVQGGFPEVIAVAGRLARPGDMVLLSPACSSFDMFEDYEDRGRRFAALAREAA